MVYSTCSFAKKQNEGIILWFLQQHPTAELLTVDFDGVDIKRPSEPELAGAVKVLSRHFEVQTLIYNVAVRPHQVWNEWFVCFRNSKTSIEGLT